MILVKIICLSCIVSICLSQTDDLSTSTINPDFYFKDPQLDWLVWCKLQPDGHDCSKLDEPGRSSFYYDIKLEDCKTTVTGNCPNNMNQFNTMKQCHETCKDAGSKQLDIPLDRFIYCRLQPDFGGCNDYFPMWYFDLSERVCKGFSYSGCGGNNNKFATYQACSSICGVLIDT